MRAQQPTGLGGLVQRVALVLGERGAGAGGRTRRQGHALIGEALLLAVGQTAVEPPAPDRESAGLGGLVQRVALVLGERGAGAGGRTRRQGHALIGEALLLAGGQTAMEPTAPNRESAGLGGLVERVALLLGERGA